MISPKMQSAINEQINKEFFSEFLYRSMQAYFASQDLDGFATWMDVRCQEEHFHAMKFFNYLIDRNGKVELKAISQPAIDFDSPLQAFSEALKHEQFITESINTLMDVAIKENDHASKSFLQWYIDEQVEEESNVGKVVTRLKLIGKDPQALFILDNELGQRVYVPPVMTQ